MSLTGVWTNELRSLRLLREGADHGLTGVFHSLVGRESGSRTLAGRTSCEEDGKQMVGFALPSRLEIPLRDTGTSQFVHGPDGLKGMNLGLN